MVQVIAASFQSVRKEDALPILMVVLAMNATGHKAVFARSIVAGKNAVLLIIQESA